MAGSVLLDTCAAIWLMNGDPMSQQSRTAMSAAQVENLGLYVSPISAWEIGTLTARNRIQLALDPETEFRTPPGTAGFTACADVAAGADRLQLPAGLTAARSGRSDYCGHGAHVWAHADYP